MEVVEQPKKSLDIKKEVRSAVIRRPDPNVQRRPRSNNTDLIGRLADAFDPHALQAREDDRSHRSLQNSQIFTLTQQLRDANNTIESLRSQINNLQSRLHEADRARDRLEIEQKMLAEMERRSRRRTRQHRTRRSESTKRSLQRVGGKVRCEEKFPEGGSYTYWVTDPSESESGSDIGGNKENMPPPASFLSGSGRYHNTSGV